jgi:tricarballylate dehydrogenase
MAAGIETSTFDLVVVGCGISGLSAAVSAQQAGAKVAVLERAVREERGGNTRYTESYWRMQSPEEVSADFEDQLAANSGGWPDPSIVNEAARPYEEWPALLRAASITDPELIATLAREAPVALQWLQSFGVTFDFLPNYFINESTTRMAPVGGGAALVEALATYAESVPDDIAIFYETTARGLIYAVDGAVVGIEAVGRGNQRIDLRGDAVVLASGGFEGNPEMLSHYLGPQALFIRPVARGGHYNRGEGIRMALAAGAAPAGDYGSFHAQPVDPRSGEQEPVVLTYTYGILVNKLGRRFVNEAPGTVDATYESRTREIMKQPEGWAWAIHDGRLDDVPNWQKAIRTREPPIVADTLDDLAAAIALDAATLKRTIAEYNAACPDPAGFDPLHADGLETRGLEPPKSHWSRVIDRPPFRAWPIIAANCFTFGGVKVNSDAQVINMDGEVIPGLYAAGEVVGLYYRNYPGSTSVMRGAVTGRLAAADFTRRRNALRRA